MHTSLHSHHQIPILPRVAQAATPAGSTGTRARKRKHPQVEFGLWSRPFGLWSLDSMLSTGLWSHTLITQKLISFLNSFRDQSPNISENAVLAVKNLITRGSWATYTS